MNAAERIGQDLTSAILRGDYAPGSHLPRLRDLAVRYHVNPSTMQRALARLEERRLITARQGSGLRVNDPAEVADLSLVPDLLLAFADDPDRAADILTDVLLVRRLLAVHIVRAHRVDLLAELPRLSEIVNATLLRKAPVAEIQMDLLMVVVEASGRPLLRSVVASLRRVLELSPIVADAMFSTPDESARRLQWFLDLFTSAESNIPEMLDEMLTAQDAETVTRFRQLLTARQRVGVAAAAIT